MSGKKNFHCVAYNEMRSRVKNRQKMTFFHTELPSGKGNLTPPSFLPLSAQDLAAWGVCVSKNRVFGGVREAQKRHFLRKWPLRQLYRRQKPADLYSTKGRFLCTQGYARLHSAFLAPPLRVQKHSFSACSPVPAELLQLLLCNEFKKKIFLFFL